MAWEKLTLSQPSSVAYRVALSLVWIGLLIAGARLTNFNEPYLPFAIAGGFVFFFRAAPSRWEIYAWLFTSTLMIKVIHLPQVPFWVLRVAASLAVLAFGAILLLGLRALWSDQEGRENSLALLIPSLILVLFILCSANALRLSAAFNPKTYDAWLYAFDGSLGFQPSFCVGKVMYHSIVLTRITLLTYLSLPFAMAGVTAWRIPPAARKISWHMLTVLLLAGVAGWLLYNVVPATGPLYAFARDFPWNPMPYKTLSTFPLEKVSIPLGIPRNAMPSLHVGWVILLCWNSRGIPRPLRTTLILYLLLTVVATLGSGQHYLVDLVVSIPFALAVQSVAGYSLHAKSRRIASLVAGLGLTIAWLWLVRFGVSFVLASPAIPWSLVLVTVSLGFWFEHRMSQSSPNHGRTEELIRSHAALNPTRSMS